MAKKFRHAAREWLHDDSLNVIHDHAGDYKHGPALVEDLYRAGALRIDIGGSASASNEADTLFVTLPKDREAVIAVMTLLAWQHGDEVYLVDGEKDVIRIWWG